MRFFDPRDAVPHVPAWRDQQVQVERELDGLSNRSFLVRSGDERFVLRLDGPQTTLFDVDRMTELLALDRAARAGIAPAIVFADAGAGILVTRYLPGRTLDADDLGDAGNVDRIAALLRRVHGLGRCGRAFDLPAIARHYASSIAGDDAGRVVRVLEDAPAAERVVGCHNDVIAANLIDAEAGDTNRLYLIDWEYARDNDPLFDIATLVAYHDLDASIADACLSAYLGGARPEDRERLAVLMRVYDALHWLWLAARAKALPGQADHAQMDRLARRIG